MLNGERGGEVIFLPGEQMAGRAANGTAHRDSRKRQENNHNRYASKGSRQNKGRGSQTGRRYTNAVVSPPAGKGMGKVRTAASRTSAPSIGCCWRADIRLRGGVAENAAHSCRQKARSSATEEMHVLQWWQRSAKQWRVRGSRTARSVTRRTPAAIIDGMCGAAATQAANPAVHVYVMPNVTPKRRQRCHNAAAQTSCLTRYRTRHAGQYAPVNRPLSKRSTAVLNGTQRW